MTRRNRNRGPMRHRFAPPEPFPGRPAMLPAIIAWVCHNWRALTR